MNEPESYVSDTDTETADPEMEPYLSVACIVCRHVANGERDVLYLSNAPYCFDAWCGLDESDPKREDGYPEGVTAVCFGCLYERDKSLSIIKKLPYEWTAKRESKYADWEIFYDPDPREG